MRPTRHQMMMDFALDASKRSICGRLIKVGCVISNPECTKVEAIGYNGPASGLPHDCGGDPDIPGACSCVHAEANSLIKAPYGPVLRMYSTLSPCIDCARLVLNSTVTELVYLRQYRDTAGITILFQGGIRVFELHEQRGILIPISPLTIKDPYAREQ